MDRLTEWRYEQDLRNLARDLSERSKPFCIANDRKAAWQLLNTSLLFFPIMVIMFALAGSHYWLVLLLAVPAGALLTRFFALQHDCGHGSLFESRDRNELVGRLISVMTFTPYDHWRRSHAMHHATSGNLDRRGIGDIDTLTVREFVALGFWGRLRYRALRHPVVSLIVGPPLYFMFLQRFMFSSRMDVKASLRSILTHDLALVAFYAALMLLLGPVRVVSVVVPVLLVGSWIGGALFYVQHQFEETLWDSADEWDVKVAALKGSSHLKLHPVLNWLSCDIGIHHVHHLSSRIPNYRLRECLNALPELQTIAPVLTLRSAIRTARLALWDEASRKLISFRQFRRQAKTQHA